ncbi:helix-turn-helix transcriptional regulator [Aeromicrobium terrae]|uniref:WYL domain-containing protein n=1 Tax=Aeromicrobium terrae TaxID=2498846 RepID=A0A5C8NMK9_9ACTN|nr:WYL domain-containing protein [Aeromicrobium terrae]TXL63094.1 WYL domain-containing protein [Aeromicrobium terrae]
MSRSGSQVQRMLALVPYLQGHDGIPVRDVAEEFGVTPKQIRDDLRLLMYTGVGEYAGELIDFDLGALEEDGVVYIRDAEFMPRPLRLNSSEGVALIVALRALRASASGAQLPIIDSALAKLETAVGEQVDAPVDVHLEDVDAALQTTLVHALQSGQRVRIVYGTASRDDRTERDVDPRRLFTENGRLYLEAWCLKAEDLRFFRLDRIESAELTGESADDHDAEPRDLASAFFTVGDDTPYAVLDLEPRAHWLTEYYPVQDVERRGDLLRVRMFGGDWSWLRRLVLRNAGSVHVVEPASLADEVRDHARLALGAYDEQ